MKLLSTFAFVTLTALSLGGTAQAKNFGEKLAAAYTAAGYENVTVTHQHGEWSVTGTLDGVTQSFTVDHKTGKPQPAGTKSHRHGGNDDGAGHDAGDDNGGHGADDGAGHDVGDDHGGHGADDGAGHDAGDDHGGNGGGHGGDDGADHDAGDDHGGHGGADD